MMVVLIPFKVKAVPSKTPIPQKSREEKTKTRPPPSEEGLGLGVLWALNL